jgi:pimeloyl-ACP methyl ester carboxylesterase
LRQRLLSSAARAVDRAVTLAVHSRSAYAREIGHAERLQLLGELAAAYEPARCAGYFRPARTLEPELRSVRQGPGARRVLDLAWPSAYRAFLPEVEQQYQGYVENRTACARMFVRERPRPVAILIHGYLAGRYPFEQRVWPLDWLDRAGLDAALFVLPFHALRACPEERVPPFLTGDPRLAHEGFRQTTADLLDLVQWLRSRGHPAVGLMGMSLGGYTSALAATVDPELDFVVPIIPLASLADFALEQGRLSSGPGQQALEHAALERVYRLICPVQRAPLVPRERVLVIGAEADRITPLSHAQRLSRHFGARLQTWPGGHLLQLGRARAFEHVGALLRELGLVSGAELHFDT